MTENELTKAIAIYKKTLEVTADNGETCFRELDKNTLSFLEELEQYRAIGTVEEVKSIVYIGKWGYKKGYNEAIDEFAEKLSLEISESIIWDMLVTMSKNSSLSDTSDEIVDYVSETSKKIAEQLKAGGKNE